jgi:hypothetical protein
MKNKLRGFIVLPIAVLVTISFSVNPSFALTNLFCDSSGCQVDFAQMCNSLSAPLNFSQLNGCSTPGHILKWNAGWACAPDDAGPSYTNGTGILISSGQISVSTDVARLSGTQTFSAKKTFLSNSSDPGVDVENQSSNSSAVALVAKNTGAGGAASFQAGNSGTDAVAISSYAASPYASLYVNNLNASAGYAIYGSAYSGGTAVTGWTDSGNGVKGGASAGYGIYGQASTGYAVYGRATSNGYGGYFTSTSGWAGYFSGNVYVSGTLSKAAGAFRIDHQLDPEQKILSHSFVESPDMKNIYDGVVALDGTGEAWVTLPDYFEALNKDFRYQLTPIGAQFVPYVAEEIEGNRFKIAGGTAGKKVSWQVTGTRRDAYARAHPIVVEEAKPASEQGTYLNPDAFGQPTGKGTVKIKDETAQGDLRQTPVK